MPGEIEWSQFTSGNDMQVGDQSVGLRSGVNMRFNFPSDGIKDANGNYLIGWSSVGASAVNYLEFSNSATGNPALLTTAGSDASVGLTLATKGSGNILFTPGGTGNIQCSTHLILSTSSPATSLEAASKGYVDSKIISTPVSLANGGTGASLTASNGGIFYSNSTTGAILPGTATANQVLVSGASMAPQWTTATYPFTTTANQLLYSSSANTIAGLATANNGTLITNSSGAPSILAGPSSTGNVLQANTASAPSWSTATYPSTTTINQILYSSSNNTVGGLATANSSVLITSAGGAPSLSQTLPSAVQGNITTVGTITSGTWNGSTITGQYGGTGVNNGASTITIGGNFSMVGAFTFAGTLTNTTTVTFPTSGTLATTSQLPTLPLSLANGGTNANLTAANGGIFYSTATAGSILAPTATANQVLMSGSNTTPAWSTAVYPATTTVNQILYSSSANVIAGLSTANNGILVTSAGGVPSIGNTVGAGLTMPSITFNTTAGIIGTTTNNSASAGSVGELISGQVLSASSISLTTGTATTVVSISLTAGDWDVFGNVSFFGGSTTVVQDLIGFASTTATTLPDRSFYAINNYASAGLTPFNNASVGFAIPSITVSLASSGTVYLTVWADFSVSTCTACGHIYARRRR